MIFTQIMRSNIKKELTYQYFSRVLLLTFIVILFFSLWNLYLQMKEAQDYYSQFLKTRAEFVSDGISIEEALKQKSNVQLKKTNGGEVATIDNVLRYDYDNVVTSIYISQPKKSITLTLEWMTFLFFPFIFTMYGIYVGTYDFRYKTIKIRSVQDKWKHILLSKQLSIYITTLVIVSLNILL
ncbi:ABC transporter permease, partial [Neobacillus sp. SM06]